jgi:hypothetical protein
MTHEEEAGAALLRIEDILRQIKELKLAFLTEGTLENATTCLDGAILALNTGASLIKSEFK